VEGPDLNLWDPQILHPGAKFAGGSVCVGEGQHSVGCVNTGFYAVCNAMRNSSSFTASSTGNYADRTKQGLSGNPLLII
jgi:Ni,Fe-hydrogenase I small subunit